MRRGKTKTPKKVVRFDKTLLLLSIVLTIAGVVAVADASSPQALTVFSDPLYFAKQQAVWSVIGLIFMLLAIIFPRRLLQKAAWPFLAMCIFLLVAVLVPGVGTKTLGARRWIYLGAFSIQPSELSKLAISFAYAKLSVSKKTKIGHYIAILVILIALIMLQPDFGTAMVVTAVSFALMFISGIPIFYLISIFLIGALSGLLLILTSEYRRERLMTFIKISDPLGSSYHIRQILIAIGSGGIFGVGLGASRQKHLFLPETATDSVFAIVAEETGFVGSLILISLLVIFTLRCFKIAANADDKFSKVLGAGISLWFGAQVFFNIASMVALTPLTGIPLPFFSYGGSHLVSLLLSVGILINISRHEKN